MIVSAAPLLTRRRLLATAAAGAAFAATPSAARAPLARTQVPAYYRFTLGAFEGTVISDGALPMGDPAGLFTGAGRDDMRRMLAEAFLSPDTVTMEQNVLLLNTADRLILFDTGMGTSKMFGPSTGRLLATMRLAGYDPKDVDAVVISHAHVDHCNAIMADDGSRNFPNAQIYMHKADFDFWTDEGKLGSPLKDLIVAARTHLVPNRDRMAFFADGQEFLPGLQAMHAPGHTIGHTVFLITSQGRTLCNAADLAHHPVLPLARPQIGFAFDTDAALAAQSRARVLDMLAVSRTPMLAYHFPWPGIGHVARQGGGYRYLPAPMQMTP